MHDTKHLRSHRRWPSLLAHIIFIYLFVWLALLVASSSVVGRYAPREKAASCKKSRRVRLLASSRAKLRNSAASKGPSCWKTITRRVWPRHRRCCCCSCRPSVLFFSRYLGGCLHHRQKSSSSRSLEAACCHQDSATRMRGSFARATPQKKAGRQRQQTARWMELRRKSAAEALADCRQDRNWPTLFVSLVASRALARGQPASLGRASKFKPESGSWWRD